MTARDMGDAGSHLRAQSSDNRVEGATVQNTGRTTLEYGEGIYIGSAESNWCRYSACGSTARWGWEITVWRNAVSHRRP